MKRLIDLAIASLLLVIAAPAVAVCALLIRIDSEGAAFFRQQRVGKDKKPFTLIKLRTMRTGTGDRPSHEAGQNNITGIGRMLRRTKLDELPQLINVVKGEMSLVGPRPCLPTQDELISAREMTGAFSVLPGITGPAQIAGVDMSTPRELAEIDGRYAKEATVIGDVQLLLATILKGRGDAAASQQEK